MGLHRSADWDFKNVFLGRSMLAKGFCAGGEAAHAGRKSVVHKTAGYGLLRFGQLSGGDCEQYPPTMWELEKLANLLKCVT